MSEAKLWKDMKKNIGHKGHFSRVESHETSSGIPDVDYCLFGTENHVELKFGHIGKPAPEIRGSQVRWFRDRVEAGGHPWLFTHISGNNGSNLYMLHLGKNVGRLSREKQIAEWEKLATFVWHNKMDWAALAEALSVNWSKR